MKYAVPSIVFLVSSFLTCGKAHAENPLPEDDFGQLPRISAPDLSPDGRYLAYRTVYDGQYALMIKALDGSDNPKLWRPTEDGSLGKFSWTADNHLFVITEKLDVTEAYSIDPGRSGSRKKYFAFFNRKRPKLLDASGKMITDLTLRRLGRIRYLTLLADTELVTEELPVFVGTVNKGSYGSKFNPATIEVKRDRYRFDSAPTNTSGSYRYVGTADGSVRFAERKAFGAEEKQLWRSRQNESWERLDSGWLEKYYILGAVDDDTLLVTGPNGISQYRLSDSTATLLIETGSNTIRQITSPDRRSLAGVALTGDAEKLIWLDDQEANRHSAAEDAIDRGVLSPLDSSHNGKIRLVKKKGSSTLGQYYLFNIENGEENLLGTDYPSLQKYQLADVQRISYRARDGLEIEGYLTLPAKPSGNPSPLIVMPHGGPASRDNRAALDIWRQYLAHLGYSVFQPNFRGSTGYGGKFAAAGKREWGGKMQTDIVDGVTHLIEQGLADEEQLAILGISYGGYAALMGALDETPYQCTVSINGVSDLPGMLSVEQISGSFDYWYEHIGADMLTEEDLLRRSPLRRADEYEIPVLLIHGTLDITVQKGQSAELAKELSRLGKDVTTLWLEKSDHYLEIEDERIQAFGAVREFLSGCLPTGNEQTSTQKL